MAKREINYENLAWVEPPQQQAVEPLPPPEATNLLRQMAHQTMLYLNFEAVRAIDELALAESRLHHKVKRHDIIIEAIAEYLAKRGINVEVRAKPKVKNRNDG